MMTVTRFRLGELDEITLAELPLQLRDLQPHRVQLKDIDWLQMQEAQFPLGRPTTVLPIRQVTPRRAE